MAMTHKQQWKLLKRPIILEAWTNRQRIEIKSRREFVRRAAQGETAKLVHTEDNCYAAYFNSLIALKSMWDAEREGIAPLVWKLTHG